MLSSWRVAAVAGVSLCFAGATWAKPALIESGAIQGIPKNGLTIYMGVPFAEPPLGQLRWREPQRVSSWKGVRKADSFAPACMHKDVSMPGETMPAVSEDCLYLNIWTAAQRAGKRLPVFVWIHGGGYGKGSASMPLYWGDRLALKGIVVVTIAYRLGPLGFLAHPELTRESPNQSSGNYGLMDQIAALEWIQRNIEAFGGDSKRVTIAGQSAGAMAVSILMASPRAKGLFQRAVAESGGLFEPLQLAPSYLLANAEHDGEAYATSLGVASIERLRRLPAEDLLGGKAGAIAHPIIEPYVLPAAPYEIFASGRQHDVPVLLGFNAEEARALVDLKTIKASTFAADLQRSFGPLVPPQIIAAYPHATDEEAKQARVDLERDLRFGWDMWTWARLHTQTGRSNVYFYYFKHKPPFPEGSVYEGWGASHYAELWYVFDHLNQSQWRWTAADLKLAQTMSDYWTQFAKFGDPNGLGLYRWPAFAGQNGNILHLGNPITVGGLANIERLRVFDSVYTNIRNSSFGPR